MLSLVLSVVLFISANAFVTDLKLTSDQMTEVTTYDIVYASSYQALVTYSGTAKARDMTDDYWEYSPSYALDDIVKLPIQFQFLDESTYLSILAELGLLVEEYTGQNAKLIAVSKIKKAGEYMDLFTNVCYNAVCH